MIRQIFVSVLCFLILFGLNDCSLKKEEPRPDPRDALLRYRNFRTDWKLQEAYAMLADTCKSLISEEEFIAYNDAPDSIKASQVYNLLSVDSLPVFDYTDIARFKVRYHFVDKSKNTSSDGTWFYSLVYENKQWKLIWLSKMINIATAHLRNQQYDQSKLLFEVITGINPFNEEALKGLALSYANLSQINDAIRIAKQMVELMPDSHSNHAILADLYGSADQFEASIRNYKKAISIEPVPVYYVNLGNIYKLNEQYVEADESYRESLKMDSTLLEGWWMLGELYYQNLDDSETARKYYRKAIELPPLPNNYQSELYYSYSLFLFSEAVSEKNEFSEDKRKELLVDASKFITKARKIDLSNSDYSFLQNEINIKLQEI